MREYVGESDKLGMDWLQNGAICETSAALVVITYIINDAM